MTPSPPIYQPSDAHHFWLALGQHSPRLLRIDNSARSRPANHLQKRPLRSFSPSPIPILRGKAIERELSSNLAQPDAAAKSP